MDGLVEKVRIVDYRVDPMDLTATVYLSDGRAVKVASSFDMHHKRGELALEAISRMLGVLGPDSATDRVDVIQDGRKVGELPAFWTPALAKSSSFLYDYRHGDLTLIDGKWHASRSLGAGDLDCLVGFVRKQALG